MGRYSREKLYELLHQLDPHAIWPKIIFKTADPAEEPDYDYGPTEQVDRFIDDINALLRAMTFRVSTNGTSFGGNGIHSTEALSNELCNATLDEALLVEEVEQLYDNKNAPDAGADPEDEGEPAGTSFGAGEDEAEDLSDFKGSSGRGMCLPSDMAAFFVQRYQRLLAYTPAKYIDFVMDYIGGTPKIKEIRRVAPSQKPVVWPRERQNLFAGDRPFCNTIHEYFADPEAKRLLYQYLTERLLIDMPQNPLFTEGCVFTIYGGIHSNLGPNGCAVRVCWPVGQAAPSAPELVPFWTPRAEADLVMRWIMNEYRSQCNILLYSPDSDFIPIVLHVIDNKYRYDQEPRKYNIYWRSNTTMDLRIDRETFIRARLPNGTKLDPYAPIYHTLSKQWDKFRAEQLALAKEKKRSANDLPHIPGEVSLASPTPATTKGGRKTKSVETVDIKLRRCVQVINMNEMYESVWHHMHHLGRQCQRCNPIEVFATICSMTGGDYVSPLPYLTLDYLLYAYYLAGHEPDGGGCLCTWHHDQERVHVDPSAATRIVCRAYRLLHKISYAEMAEDTTRALHVYAIARAKSLKIEAQRKKLEKQINAGVLDRANLDKLVDKNPPVFMLRMPREDISVFLANVRWDVNYYLYGYSSESNPYPDPLQVHTDGVSIHGYTFNEINKKHELALRVCPLW